jgi:hypothetical protein
MPTNVKVIEARDFISARPGGVLDLHASESLLHTIMQSASALDSFQVLLDTRRALGVLSTTDLWYLSQKLAQDGTWGAHKTAVLVPHDRFDHAQFFTMCAEGRGLNVRAFLAYEDAMEWLLDDRSAQR